MGLFDKLKAKIAVAKDDWDEHLTEAQHRDMTKGVNDALKQYKADEDKLEKDVKFKDKPKDLEKAIIKAGEEFEKKLKELKSGYKKLAEHNIIEAQKSSKDGSGDVKKLLDEAAKHVEAAVKKAVAGVGDAKKISTAGVHEQKWLTLVTTVISKIETNGNEMAKSASTALIAIKTAAGSIGK